MKPKRLPPLEPDPAGSRPEASPKTPMRDRLQRPRRSLTPRQREVARLLARGYAKKQIAFDLNISPHTVTRHITDIYECAGVHDKVNLVFYLLREGIIQVEHGQPARPQRDIA